MRIKLTINIIIFQFRNSYSRDHILTKKIMILNLNKQNLGKTTQNNLFTSQSFLLKNKITVNEPVHTHYSVEGVQMYSAAEIKALKESQQRNKKFEDKQPVQVKLYQIADYFDQFEESKQIAPKQRVRQALRAKEEKDLSKNTSNIMREKKEVPVKQKLAKNNNILSRLEKQRGKKSVLQKKLSQLSKHYKQYFKEPINSTPQKVQQLENDDQIKKSSLCESIKKISKSKPKRSDDEDEDEEEDELDSSESNVVQGENSKLNEATFKRNNRKTFSIASTNNTKLTANRLQKKQKPSVQQVLEENKSDSQNLQFQEVEEELDLIGQVLDNRSTYSEKLGSAVHLLFM